MMYLPGLALVLTGLWLALSGQTAPLFLVLGGFSVLVSLWIAAKLDLVDREGAPYLRLPQFLSYSAWLAVEVVKSNVAVIGAVLGPRSRLDPGLVALQASSMTGLGKATFANSITLTPGTVTVDIHDGRFVVHALDRNAASPESFKDMDRRSHRAADGLG
jgi:multicomponent Na+:H+ antiporter subunit E